MTNRDADWRALHPRPHGHRGPGADRLGMRGKQASDTPDVANTPPMTGPPQLTGFR